MVGALLIMLLSQCLAKYLSYTIFVAGVLPKIDIFTMPKAHLHTSSLHRLLEGFLAKGSDLAFYECVKTTRKFCLRIVELTKRLASSSS